MQENVSITMTRHLFQLPWSEADVLPDPRPNPKPRGIPHPKGAPLADPVAKLRAVGESLANAIPKTYALAIAQALPDPNIYSFIVEILANLLNGFGMLAL